MGAIAYLLVGFVTAVFIAAGRSRTGDGGALVFLMFAWPLAWLVWLCMLLGWAIRRCGDLVYLVRWRL